MNIDTLEAHHIYRIEADLAHTSYNIIALIIEKKGHRKYLIDVLKIFQPGGLAFRGHIYTKTFGLPKYYDIQDLGKAEDYPEYFI